MGDSCLPGLQGFPIQVTGWSGFEDKISIDTPNDIFLQFSPNKLPSYYNKDDGSLTVQGTNTFFMGGTQYMVRVVRLSSVKQEGLANFSQDTILFEYHIWGTPVQNSLAKADAALLCIPVVKKPQETDAGQTILQMLNGDTVQFIDTIPRGNGADVIKYSTCIETNDKTKKTITIAVAYWSNGAACIQSRLDKWAGRLGMASAGFAAKDFVPPGVPDIFGFQLLSGFTLANDEYRTKTSREYKVTRGILQPYSTLVPIGVGASEFKNGFRMIRNFDFQKKQRLGTDAYKCIAIDRSRDIRGGKLLVDPATGRRLDDEINAANAEQSPDTNVKSPEDTKKILLTICVIIGCIIGGCLLAGLVSFIFAWILNRKSQGIIEPSILDKLPSSIAGLPEAAGAATTATVATTAVAEPTTMIGKIGSFFSSMIPSFQSVKNTIPPISSLPALPAIPPSVHVSLTGPDPSCPLPTPTT